VREIYNHYKNLLPSIPHDHIYQPYWKYDKDRYPVVHLTYDPFPHDYSIIMLYPTKEKVEGLMKLSNISLHVYMLDYFPELDDFPVEWKRKISWWKIKNKDYFVNEEEKYRYLSKLARGDLIINSDDFNVDMLAKLS
jgi:hypothetical protein